MDALWPAGKEDPMQMRSILIVDDEKNIRLTMSQSLELLGIPVQTAANGEEALRKLHEDQFRLVFLDLKMPGMDGMEVLRRIKENWPNMRVIVITAHGTIESAVEAMKLGAVDFIRKPFSPGEIRALATQVLEREALDEEGAADYRTLIELARRHITDRRFDAARAGVRKAIASDPGQPEAYNLLAALCEIGGDRLEAQNFYRVALDIDPTYSPARTNLERTTSWRKSGKVDLGPDKPATASDSGQGEGNKHDE
jgi:DNA-binding response OmpR family regulator